MKRLVEFIKESIYMTESKRTELEYLVNYYDNDDVPQIDGLQTEILSAKGLYDISKCLQSCISAEDLEKLYKFRDENIEKLSDIQKRPEPIVANYNGSKSRIAFRRWVKTYEKEMGITINLIDGKPGSTFHDTSLKGNGREGIFEPNAQDMEDVLSVAYNNLAGVPFEVMMNTMVSTKDRKSKLTNVIDWYQGHSESMNRIAGIIPPEDKSAVKNGICKLETKYSKAVDSWKKLGGYSGSPENTPKTDIVSVDASGHPINTGLRISVKKTGGSQAMSGNYNESKATILSALNNIKETKKTEDLIKFIKAYFENADYDGWGGKLHLKDTITNIKKTKSGEDYDTVTRVEDMTKPLADALNELISVSKEFRLALLKEAMSGESKFGKDSVSTATSVLEWNDLEPKKSKYYPTIDEFIADKVMKTKFIIVFKSASAAWMVMRIIIGNTAEELDDASLENVEEND